MVSHSQPKGCLWLVLVMRSVGRNWHWQGSSTQNFQIKAFPLEAGETRETLFGRWNAAEQFAIHSASGCLFVCLSVCLFVCFSVCLFVCLSVCLLVS